LLQQREGERLAVLDWIRAGASAEAYAQDDHPLTDTAGVVALTEIYRRSADRVKVRSILVDRCVSCHGESGRHDTARFIELDTYDRLARRLEPERAAHAGRPWLLAALVALFPLAALVIPVFSLTKHRRTTRVIGALVTVFALLTVLACWFTGPPAAALLLAAALLAAMSLTVQGLATLHELLGL
jgi:uncharacterized membrane protein